MGSRQNKNWCPSSSRGTSATNCFTSRKVRDHLCNVSIQIPGMCKARRRTPYEQAHVVHNKSTLVVQSVSILIARSKRWRIYSEAPAFCNSFEGMQPLQKAVPLQQFATLRSLRKLVISGCRWIRQDNVYAFLDAKQEPIEVLCDFGQPGLYSQGCFWQPYCHRKLCIRGVTRTYQVDSSYIVIMNCFAQVILLLFFLLILCSGSSTTEKLEQWYCVSLA